MYLDNFIGVTFILFVIDHRNGNRHLIDSSFFYHLVLSFIRLYITLLI